MKKRKSLNSHACREAEALEALMLDSNTPEEKRLAVLELITELANLTSFTLAHPRIVRLAYREMLYASREQRPETLYLEDMTPEERHYEVSIRRILTQICDVIDPERASGFYNSFIERFAPGAYRREEAPEQVPDASLAPVVDLSCWRQSRPRPIRAGRGAER